MSKHNKYILVRWYWADGGDHPDYSDTEFTFITNGQLENITKLMEDYSIKRWVKDPETIPSGGFIEGDASLIEFRNLTVKPIKIVESWSYTSEVGL